MVVVVFGPSLIFGRVSEGISGPKLPLWADFSFQTWNPPQIIGRKGGRRVGKEEGT